MTKRPTIAFLLNLVQDVSILRPVAQLAAAEFDVRILFLASSKFASRDTANIWCAELSEIAADIGAEMHAFEDAFDAYSVLQGGYGAIFAASESNLPAHHETHSVFQSAPSGYARVALQHGYECVGFLQNRQHDLAHGLNITFAADILAGWTPASRLRSMPSSQRDKLIVTGPSTLLSTPPSRSATPEGIVCENLHSVRLSAGSAARGDFMGAFGRFSAALAAEGEEKIWMRPHPGGQFVLRRGVPLPPNTALDNRPLYKIDLSSYGYGISPPSSILIDMLLAGLPAAVWVDAASAMDVSNYEGLTFVNTAADWLAFRRDAQIRREAILIKQRRFLSEKQLPTDRHDVRKRFVDLICLATEHSGLNSLSISSHTTAS